MTFSSQLFVVLKRQWIDGAFLCLFWCSCLRIPGHHHANPWPVRWLHKHTAWCSWKTAWNSWFPGVMMAGWSLTCYSPLNVRPFAPGCWYMQFWPWPWVITGYFTGITTDYTFYKWCGLLVLIAAISGHNCVDTGACVDWLVKWLLPCRRALLAGCLHAPDGVRLHPSILLCVSELMGWTCWFGVASNLRCCSRKFHTLILLCIYRYITSLGHVHVL